MSILEKSFTILPVIGSILSDSSAMSFIAEEASFIACWNIPDLIPSLSINAPVPSTNAPVTPILSSIARCTLSSSLREAKLSSVALLIAIVAANLLAFEEFILPSSPAFS